LSEKEKWTGRWVWREKGREERDFSVIFANLFRCSPPTKKLSPYLLTTHQKYKPLSKQLINNPV